MGACVSLPVAEAAAGSSAGAGGAPRPPSAPQSDGITPPAPPACGGGGPRGACVIHHVSSDAGEERELSVDTPGAAAAAAMDILAKVGPLQQKIAALGCGSPLLTLSEASHLLLEHLGAELVAVYGTSSGPSSLVLLSAAGAAAGALERCAPAMPAGAGGAAGAVRCYDFSGGAQLDEAPAELAALHQETGLTKFWSAAIGPASGSQGALLFAPRGGASAPRGDAEGWWTVSLQALSTVLLQPLQHAQTRAMCDVLASLHEAGDPTAAAGLLLSGAQRYMARVTGMRMTARLALLLGADAPRALLLEPAPRSPGSSAASGLTSSCSSRDLAAAAAAAAGVVASEMELQHTLLGSALERQQARFIKDVAQYMQATRSIARDVFGRASEAVSSIVVVPLFAPAGQAMGGLYFAADGACPFEEIQGALLGFVHTVTPALELKLACHAGAMAEQTAKARRRASRFSSGLPAASAGPQSTSAAGTAGQCHASASSPSWGAPPCGSSSQRLNTESMLQLLQQEVRSKSRTDGRGHDGHLRGLVLGKCLGRGGMGRVYKGRWHKATAAIKVMAIPKDEQEAMLDAMEMAVVSMVRHPNIVQCFACLTDMVEVADSDGGNIESSMAASLDSGDLGVSYRRLLDTDDADDVTTCNLLVMEYCDRGTLRAALREGAFHLPLAGGAMGVHIGGVLEVLLDVASAVASLHSMHIVHGDIRPDNVLLKTDPSRPRGFVSKLSDFSRSKVLSESAAAGAPAAGPGAAAAADVRAFGLLMWQLFMNAKLPSSGAAPSFPSTAPPAYARLAEDCWGAGPAAPLGFSAIVQRLEALAATYTPETAA